MTNKEKKIGAVKFVAFILKEIINSKMPAGFIANILNEGLSEGTDYLSGQIEGNEITYIFDLSKMDGYSEDIVKDEEVISSLETSLISSAPTFGGISKQLEEQTKVKGITTTVNYTWEDEVLITKSFTSADAIEDTAE